MDVGYALSYIKKVKRVYKREQQSHIIIKDVKLSLSMIVYGAPHQTELRLGLASEAMYKLDKYFKFLLYKSINPEWMS